MCPFVVCALFLLFSTVHVDSAVLKTISKNDLAASAKINEHLLVIFVSKDCDSCKEAELQLSALAIADADEAFPVTVVRIVDTELPRSLGIATTPIVFFYRHQNPIIYDGTIEAATVNEWISYNQESSLKILSDDNFEHLTQSGSGATTGDWLVVFCDARDESCVRFQPVYETVASKSKGRLNVAFVDTSKNTVLSNRFSLVKPLTIALFRLGKMYEYSIDKLDVTSLNGFALGWYKNVEGVTVPVQPSPFDQLTINIANLIKKNDSFLWLGIGVIAIIAVVAVCVTLTCSTSKAGSKTKAGKQSKPRKKE